MTPNTGFTALMDATPQRLTPAALEETVARMSEPPEPPPKTELTCSPRAWQNLQETFMRMRVEAWGGDACMGRLLSGMVVHISENMPDDEVLIGSANRGVEVVKIGEEPTP